MNKIFLILIFLFGSVLPIFGCKELEIQRSLDQMKIKCDSVMGLNEDDVIARLGIPQDVKQITEHTKVFYYRQVYGTSTNGFVRNGASWESYDQFQIIMKDGVAKNWTGNSQR